MVPWYQFLTFISWYRGTISMQQHPKVDKKLADWASAFNSMPNKHTKEAQILKSLILGYRTTIRKEVSIVAN